jgi:Na+-translocating ferredoxin:NAD+ oxidoreductase RnfD subunit
MKSYDRTSAIPATMFALLLIPVYIGAWGRFGQKVPVAVCLSLFTGLLIRIFCRKNESVAFPWAMFWVFPIFVPLGLPLWLIPTVLTAGWLISVSSFGGIGRNIFNPVATALVFLVAGYGSSVSLLVSKPFSSFAGAFSVWTAGMNPAESGSRILLKLPTDSYQDLFSGFAFPSLPGMAFPGVLLLISTFLVVFFSGRRLWLLCLIPAITAFTALAQKVAPGAVYSPLSILFMGITPAMILVWLSDERSIPLQPADQVVHALIFAFLFVGFVFMSEKLLVGIFSVLLTQMIAPLISDIISGGQNDGE